MKIITMYRTAIMAENLTKNTLDYGLKSTCNELVKNFNEGKHIINENNRESSYSISYA